MGFGLIFATLMAANGLAVKGHTGPATGVYLLFTAMEGLFLSWIVSRYTTETIGVAFLLTAGLFVGMSAIGMTTKRDISRWGPMLIIGVFGMIVISLVNIFLLQSSVLFLLINVVLLPLFSGADGVADEADEGVGPAGGGAGQLRGGDSGCGDGKHRVVRELPEHIHDHPKPARVCV